MKRPDLLDNMERSAIFGGPNDCYRLELRRVWDAGKPLLVVCMLNPSTADHLIDDPTILTLIHFGKLWSYGGLIIVNLFAFRSSSPIAMMSASEPIGAENAGHQSEALKYAEAHGGVALAAWGNDGGYMRQDAMFIARAREWRVDLCCLGTTMHGHPKHPMARGLHRIPRDQLPLPFRRLGLSA